MEREEKYSRYSLVNYTDVWGNKEDGYEINNQCVEFDDLYLADSLKIKDILKYLKGIGFLTTDDMRRFDVADYGDGYEIYAKKDLVPLCRLEIVY